MQPAGLLVARHVAADQLERDRALHGLLAAGLGERAGDVLVAERQHGASCGEPQMRHVVRVVRLVRGGWGRSGTTSS